jgi:hypothetical protein
VKTTLEVDEGGGGQAKAMTPRSIRMEYLLSMVPSGIAQALRQRGSKGRGNVRKLNVVNPQSSIRHLHTSRGGVNARVNVEPTEVKR